ncbi:MAG: flagellar hook-basal body complex protein FliE [Desulfitobacterium sp.]|nr:flagellar hook-basal body complex protein FliE [Desulfitobacterium sp.]
MAIDSIGALNLGNLNPSLNATAKPTLEEKGANTQGGAKKVGEDFGAFLKDALQKVDAIQKEAEVASVGLATGQIQDLHTAVIAMEKASIALSLTVEVRNKVIDAYHEMMRMQV